MLLTSSVALADSIESNADSHTAQNTESNIESNSQNTESKQDSINSNSTKQYTLEKVVTTARGTEQLLKDAPASITIITGEELENKPHRDLAEALADIPGVDLGTELGKTGGLKISIRGMPANYTLILIDGKRVSPAGDINTTNAGWSQADTSFMPPLSAIDRIEVIRGPMSTLYGSDAIGGVVNIITKKKIDKYGVSVGLETTQNEDRQYGSGYMLNLFGTIPIIKNTLGVQLRGRYYFRSPSDVKFKYTTTLEPPTGATNANAWQIGTIVEDVPGFIGNPTMAHIFDLGGRILYNPNENNHIYFDVQYARQWYDNSKEQLGQFASTAKEYIVTRNNYILSHKASFSNLIGVPYSMDNSIQFNQSFNDGRMTNTTPNNPRKIQGKDIIIDSKHFFELPFNNNLSVGIYYWYAYMQDLVANPSTFSQNTISLFAEDEWEIFDGFRFTLGLREDWNSRFGFNTSPKAYIVYEVLPNLLILKGGVSMGYKAPFLNELIDGQYGFGSQGRLAFLGNPNLKPEKSVSAEITAMSDNDYVEAGITYFYSFFLDKISSTTLSSTTNVALCGSAIFTSGCSRRINVDESYIQGLEVFASMKPFYGVGLDLSYTFTDSKQLTGSLKGSPLTDTLDHLFSAKLSYTWRDLHVYIRGEVQGNRFRGLNPGTNAEQQRILGAYYKPYGLLHLGATYRLNKNFKFNFAIYNLLNMTFADYRQYGWATGRGSTNANPNYTGEPSIGNMYPFIQEGRRYWFSVNMDF
ncbi:TonB-dependent receptor domain-containing protein [Helicobacter saguini]|uniref:TonB-dependent receptor domain-containing protein n=1 Tax=Helicobacter saguini TaxID=1548018 RepID=UPI001928BA57|nr:TonB-dependent receptor [Helicobacter saguini]